MEQVPTADIDQVFAHTTNLASCNLNSKVLACSNDYFASADNLLTPTPAISRPGVFVHTGAWYDGWETRRHNLDPYEWAVIKLGVAAASIHSVEVDTAHFKGDYGEEAELQATYPNRRPQFRWLEDTFACFALWRLSFMAGNSPPKSTRLPTLMSVF